jgi:hypothetical protein
VRRGAQHFLAVLRTTKLDRLTLRSAGSDAPRLTVQLLCSKSGAPAPARTNTHAARTCTNGPHSFPLHHTGLLKTYDVACIAEPEILCANVDRRALPVRIAVRPKEFTKLLANFHSGQHDVTLLSLPDAHRGGGGGGAAAGALPPDGAVKRLRLLSFEDPAKAAVPGAAMTTQLAVHSSEEIITSYVHRGAEEAEATVNLKDLKARVEALSVRGCCAAGGVY